MQDAPTTSPETVWRNGHGFRLRPELAMNAAWETPRPYIACFKCDTRADGSDATRPCIGYPVRIPPSGRGLTLDVTVTPKGRKPIEQTIWLDIDGLGPLLDLARQFPEDSRGHAFWHWQNADRDFPCSTCPSPLGDAPRRLEDARRDAIDAEPVAPKIAATLDPTDPRSHEHPDREPVASREEDRDPRRPLTHGEVATLRARAVGALHDYRRALIDIHAADPAVQRVHDALKALGA